LQSRDVEIQAQKERVQPAQTNERVNK